MDELEHDNQTADKPSSINTRRPSMHTARSLRSDLEPSSVVAPSLRSDRARVLPGRYVATELEPLRSDRAWLELGRYVATEHAHGTIAT
ncbi:hypothetical protein F2Q69_00021450 [Brassica cretica]|uniref:Uncharacterized protein n=1 Tax=Brassica cretica TaxID=69181 RepID=A0A8S9Q076_BRACR|nr:hypothetical protein F2Q69_00021450 [Brassica cretica]